MDIVRQAFFDACSFVTSRIDSYGFKIRFKNRCLSGTFDMNGFHFKRQLFRSHFHFVSYEFESDF